MEKNRKDKGFSLAELLIVVTIVTILMGVSFVAVQNHQRSMTRLEFDTIAKEIFVAAQNHLTAAESQGYLENTDYGHEGEIIQGDDDTADVFFVVSSDSYEIKKLMLPDYALDATVLSGSFIIRYQPSSATVLDVFYSKPGKGTFLTVSGVTLVSDDYFTLMGTEPNYRQGGEKNREKYGDAGGVVGWYGGATALPLGERLQVPTFEIINKEKLLVKVSIPSTPPVAGYCVKLIVIGKTSGAEAYFSLMPNSVSTTNNEELRISDNTIVLDSITENGMHFSQIVPDKIVPDKGNDFFPGEDLSIKVVAYSTEVLANVAMSAEKTTNSLFADPYPYTADKEVLGSDVEKGVAGIANIRHLENLDPAISGYIPSDVRAINENAPYQGIQLRDLSWTEFMTNTDGEEKTKIYDQSGPATDTACYYPVSPDYKITYDGNNHKISEVKVDYPADAGLFGSISVPYSEVKNLELIDFSITGTSNAGALAGSAKDAIITNVLAHNSIDKTTKKETLTENIKSPGTAGGLIGSMSGGTVTGCAAAVYVSGGTNAGGLIGTATNGTVTTVTACYSGGHTDGPDTGTATYYKDGAADYDEDTGVLNNGLYNVISASGAAGGLIGDAGSASISYSYSTCSAKGTTVGGLIGTGSGSVTGCYATGLVKGSSENATGAFAGFFSGAISTDKDKESYYYRIINEIHSADGTISYLHAIGNEKDSTDVKALDETADSYNKFVGADWKETVPYDTDLVTFYQGKYPLQTVVQLGAVLPEAEQEEEQIDWFITTHYGDWPAPEIFVINQ